MKAILVLLWCVCAVPAWAIDRTHTVVCTWCPPQAVFCEECLRDAAHPAGGCVYDQLNGFQGGSVAPDDHCPPGTQVGTCHVYHFSNAITGHAVTIPMPTGYTDRPCVFTPPLPGAVPSRAAVRKSLLLQHLPPPKP